MLSFVVIAVSDSVVTRIQLISKSPGDLQYYEDRLKFLRDERGKLLAAREESR